jgi:hypothetical protein
LVESSYADAAPDHMQVEASYVLEVRRVGRPADERGQVLDRADAALLGFGAILRIVMSSIIRRRNGLMISLVMGMFLSEMRLPIPHVQTGRSRPVTAPAPRLPSHQVHRRLSIESADDFGPDQTTRAVLTGNDRV